MNKSYSLFWDSWTHVGLAVLNLLKWDRVSIYSLVLSLNFLKKSGYTECWFSFMSVLLSSRTWVRCKCGHFRAWNFFCFHLSIKYFSKYTLQHTSRENFQALYNSTGNQRREKTEKSMAQTKTWKKWNVKKCEMLAMKLW